jgi:ComF family protein
MFQHLWPPALPWILQSICLLCDRPIDSHQPRRLCHRCTTQLRHCQRDDPRSVGDHRPPPRSPHHAAHHLAWGHYQDSLRRLLHQMKYHNQPAIAQIFGPLLAELYQQQALPPVALVPIPMHPAKQASRGYNQAELISHSLRQFTGLPHYPKLLQRPKATTAQHGLSLADRQANLHAAFTISPPHHRRHPILLIDDIYTTGATIQAATDCFTQQGYTVWGSLVVAR